MVVHAKIQMLQHQPAPQHGQIPAEDRPHPRQKWRLGWHWQQKTILQKLFERRVQGSLDPRGDRGIPAPLSAPSAMFTPPPLTMMF